MRIMIWSGTLLLTFGALVPMVVADSLYRCSDGTFTNRVDRHCARMTPNRWDASSLPLLG